MKCATRNGWQWLTLREQEVVQHQEAISGEGAEDRNRLSNLTSACRAHMLVN